AVVGLDVAGAARMHAGRGLAGGGDAPFVHQQVVVALGTQAVALHAAGGDRSGGLVVERVAVADRARATRSESSGGKAGCVAHRVAVADDQDRIRVVAGGGNGSGGVVRIVAVAGDADAVAVAARGGDGAGIDDGIAAAGDLDRLRAQHAAV